MNKRPTFTIARVSENRFAVTTDVVMSDGSLQIDSFMVLEDNVLKSHEERGLIRTGGLLKLTLGPYSLPLVHALKVGQSVIL